MSGPDYDASRVRAELEQVGYAWLRGALAPEAAADVRARILGAIEHDGPMSAEEPTPVALVGPGTAVRATVGLAIPQLLDALPELEPTLLQPRLVRLASTLLGDAPYIERVGGVASDRSRPFLSWHTHIDHQEERVRHEAGVWPRKTALERLVLLIYLDDIDAAAGPPRVLPRALGSPCDPVGPSFEPDWPGHVVLHPRAGDAVLLDQSTWHAAVPPTSREARVVVGAFFVHPAHIRLREVDDAVQARARAHSQV